MDLGGANDGWETFNGGRFDLEFAFPIAFGIGIQFDADSGLDTIASAEPPVIVDLESQINELEVGARFFDLFREDEIEQQSWLGQAHVFYRDPGRYSAGLSFGGGTLESGSFEGETDFDAYGFEINLYREKWTYGVNGAFADFDGQDVNISIEDRTFFTFPDGFDQPPVETTETVAFAQFSAASDGIACGAEANASYFPTPFIRLTGRGSLAQYQEGDVRFSQTATAARLAGEAEYKIPRSPLHLTAGASATLSTNRSFSTDAADAGVAAYLGLRLVFGPDTLVENDRRGASFEGSPFLIDTLFER